MDVPFEDNGISIKKNAMLDQLIRVLQKYNLQQVQVQLIKLMCIPD